MLYLLKPGELSLKGENRKDFERVLKRNLKTMLGKTRSRIEMTHGRFYVECAEDAERTVEDALGHLFGITGWAKTRSCEKTLDAVIHECVSEARELFSSGAKTFKIEAKRTDKSFPVDSYGIMNAAGEAILTAMPEFTVDVHHPDALITVEIRESALIYGTSAKALGGLPVGTAGRGMLLLSGGIDSPVAGFMMAGRGMRMDAVYFHAYPYTPEESRQKVIKLAGIIGAYTMGIRVWTVNFTKIEMRIKEGAPSEWTTILLRIAMMECAEGLARYRGAKCLITGESLSQVASQTIENIACTSSRVTLPILRPLIGMDKERIIRLAERIGTYETSILPYQDCCVLFSPDHPMLRGKVTDAESLYRGLELEVLMHEAFTGAVMEKCGFYEE